MKLHTQNETRRNSLADIAERLTEVAARMDRKTMQTDTDGEVSSMINWMDIRQDILELRNEAKWASEPL